MNKKKVSYNTQVQLQLWLEKAMRHTTSLVALLPKLAMVLLSLPRAIRLTTCRSLLLP